MARLKNMRAMVELTTSKLMGPERQKDLAALAQATIDEAARINRSAFGHDVSSRIIVDGRDNASVSSVKAGGMVVGLFAVHEAAVDFTWLTLAQLSPIDTGQYRGHHMLLVNGSEAGPPPVKIGVDDVVTFVNLEPYSRLIERGWSKRQAPDGVYEAASAIVRARFGNIVTVKFGYGAFFGASAGGNSTYPYLQLSPSYRRAA